MTDSREVRQLEIPPNLEIPPGFRIPRNLGNQERLAATTDKLTEKVRTLARPKAVYTTAGVECTDRDHVIISGIEFTSRILNKKLCERDTVYPFIITIGKELDDFHTPPGEMWQSFILDSLKTLVLISSVRYVTEHIMKEFNLSEVASMNPGELKDWPLDQQLPLFQLFRGKEKNIGVSVSKGGAMRPLKSRSGIVFEDSTGFVSCRCCNQSNCPGRRAAYNPALVEEYMN